jgi:MOSC domain-containing protein YiiM
VHLLVAVCAVAELHPEEGIVGVTAIDKRPVEGRVRVGPLGVRGDVQADRKNHGGTDKAVYAYAQDDADWWATQLQRDIPPGTFGENLRVSGFDVNRARVGDRWCIGTDVVLEVTMPRTPCATFARRIAALGIGDERGWVRRFSDARRLGCYLRVIHPGTIEAGTEIVVEPAAGDAPTMLDVYRAPSTA